MFAVTVVAWAATALSFSRLAAVLVPAALLLYTPFALPYHEPSSDMVVATGFALVLARAGADVPATHDLAVRRARARAGRARPRPALVPGARPRRRRRHCSCRRPGASGRAGPPRSSSQPPSRSRLWAVHNGMRYGDTTYSRSGAINVPFYPAFLRGELDPGQRPRLGATGPADRARDPRRAGLPPLRRRRTHVHALGDELRDRPSARPARPSVRARQRLRAAPRCRARGARQLCASAASTSARRGATCAPGSARFHPSSTARSPTAGRSHRRRSTSTGSRCPTRPRSRRAPTRSRSGSCSAHRTRSRRCIARRPWRGLRRSAARSSLRGGHGAVARWDEGLGARSPNAWLAARLDTLRRAAARRVGVARRGRRRPRRAAPAPCSRGRAAGRPRARRARRPRARRPSRPVLRAPRACRRSS